MSKKHSKEKHFVNEFEYYEKRVLPDNPEIILNDLRVVAEHTLCSAYFEVIKDRHQPWINRFVEPMNRAWNSSMVTQENKRWWADLVVKNYSAFIWSDIFRFLQRQKELTEKEIHAECDKAAAKFRSEFR